MRGLGHQKLRIWFGLSYASFCVMPRVLMHEMPDEWQSKMADLLDQMDKEFDNRRESEELFTVRSIDKSGKMVAMPEWLKNYRYPNKDEINRFRHE